ncbi:MAG: hypothetical protein ACRCU5_03045 [Rhizobiaceae bacterium]
MTGFDLAFTTLIVFGTMIAAVGAVLWVLRRAKRELDDAGKQTARWASFVLVAWAAFAVGFGAIIGLSFGILPFMVAAPLILGTAFSFTVRGKQLLSKIELHHIIVIQTYRFAGFIFLYLYYVPGVLTRGFALNAGIGDMLTGILAAPVAWLVWKKVQGYQYYAVAWCALGIGDLILAGASARIYGPASLGDFPINTVPLFLGPPLGILLHIFVLRILWLKHRSVLVPTPKRA